MSWITVVWSINAGICVALAGVYLLAWSKWRSSWVNLAFALCAASVACIAIFELAAMQAQTPAEYGVVVRWAHIPVAILVCSLVWFIRLHLEAGHLWLAWAICIVRGLALVVNFVSDPNISFSQITDLRLVQFWGDTVAVPLGVSGRWQFLIRIGDVLLLVLIIEAALGAWRQGRRRKASVMGASLMAAIVVAATFSVMMTRGSLPAPMTVSFAFMILMVAMGFDLGGELLRVQRLTDDLRRSETLLRTQFENSPAYILIVEPHYQIVRINKAVGGAPPEALEGSSCLELIPPQHREEARRRIDRCFETGEMQELVHEFLTGVWLETRMVRIQQKDLPDRVMILSTDVTDRRRAESERMELRLELAHLNRVMQLSELSAALAHEINQPLGAILNNAAAAAALSSQQKLEEERIGPILRDIIDDANRAGQIIRDLRALSKKGEVLFEPLDLNGVIEGVAQLLAESIRRMEASLRLELDPGLPPVRGWRVGLQQVLTNLLINALEAVEACTTRIITIRSGRNAADEILVWVEDTGRGLGKIERSRIFEPFFTTKPDGIGMGLRICQSLIGEHGGRLWLEHSSESGTRFCFSVLAWSADNPNDC